MTPDEMLRLVQDLRHRVNQQSAQIAAMGALLSAMPIDSDAFQKARHNLQKWMPSEPLHGEKGAPRLFTDDVLPASYLNRIEEAVTGKPVE